MTDTAVRLNAFGQPIGAPVPDWTPRPLPPRTPLDGRTCRLEPLNVDRHADALYAAYAVASDARDWTYLAGERELDLSLFRVYVAERAASIDPLHMAIVCDGRAVGSASLMRIDPSNGVVEVGHIHFAPQLKRTLAATEALYLLMRRVFDELGYRRLEWKCDSLNASSRRAALRLGFAFEGVFEHALVMKGRNRDTAWYSIVAERWPALRKGYEDWMAPSNFDADGRQIFGLANIRDAAV